MVSVLVRPPWQGECILVSFDRAWIWVLHGVWLFQYLSITRFYSRTQIQTIAMTLCKNNRVSVSAEPVRNAISVFHALNDWKVVSRELTKNVLIFLMLLMLCYFLILRCYVFRLYVYIYVYVMKKWCFSLNLRFLKYWKFSVSVTRKIVHNSLLHRCTFWPFEII